MTKFPFIVALVLLSILMQTACVGNSSGVENSTLADSLCSELREIRYDSAEKVENVANNILKISNASNEHVAIAYNAIAYSAFMCMDYIKADSLYKEVLLHAECEVERFVADVGMMMLCYRTSANREFFDYLTSAQSRIKRIEEELEFLPLDEKQRFINAEIEKEIVSICYFANIGIEHEMKTAMEKLKEAIPMLHDMPLRIYARMILTMQTDIPLLERAESLFMVLQRCNSTNILWLRANCRLLLAILLRDDNARLLIAKEMPERIYISTGDSLQLRDIPLNFALDAVADFESYGDNYMAIEALAVAASCNTQIGEYDSALAVLDRAIGYINNYYSAIDSLQLFSLQNVYDTEIEQFDNEDEINIAECLLSVRREASCAYAGLGDKYLSDINRNSYLDLLKTTRLNKQMESRAMAAEESANRMYVWFLIAIIALVAVSVGIYMLSVGWRKRTANHTAHMRSLLRLCRHLMTALPHELEDKESVYRAVENILNRDMGHFSGSTQFRIYDKDSLPQDTHNIFPLERVSSNINEYLLVLCNEELSAEKRSLIELALPYVSVAIDEGLRISEIADEQTEAEQQRVSYNYYLAEHKRENILKRVSLSIVSGMRPYMDRMLNELRHLSRSSSCGDIERLRLEYISELTDKLDDYNAILERWIKMRRGELNLHIENFVLAELFEIIAKGAQTFELKGITLDVKDSFAVVKADKALTLFMINTLADNAGKFTLPGGRVTVEALEGDDFVEVAVSDTGVGMAQEDIDRILNEKVYDASLIGRENSLAKNKGGGFGLMNCKGIIDKYRKTDALFGVCRMDIKSTLGKGSRFSFRLPKGVLRICSILLLMFLPCSLWANNHNIDNVGNLADSVYQCNVEGRYSDALVHAKTALQELNNYYLLTVGANDTLHFEQGTFSEIKWWRDALFADSLKEEVFYNLLDIRNEVAVASLALQNWACYRYNNAIYAQLYRLVHEDKGIALHYEKMQNLANNRHVAVVLCITLLLLLLIAYSMFYVRHGVVERMNGQLVQQMNRRLLNLISGPRIDNRELAQNVATEMLSGMRELLRITNVSVLLKNSSDSVITSAVGVVDDVHELYLLRVYENCKQTSYNGGLLHLFPLIAMSSGEQCVLGSISLETERYLTENEQMAVELIVGYVASAIYHSSIRLADKYRTLDEIQEELERTKIEENRLHVQNLVMDNCLSVIKHETIYYPGRIHELVCQLRKNNVDESVWREKIIAMKELMDYYNSIFGVLASCAMRQLDDTAFKVSSIPLNTLWQHLQNFVAKRATKSNIDIELQCEDTAAIVYGDKDLVSLLFESLLNGLMAEHVPGTLLLRAVEEKGVVRGEILDKRRHMPNDELAELFTPSRNKLVGNDVVGMEFLVAKEIVRMHEDVMGWRGGRMEARASNGGVVFYFTLPRL